ncbi:MAG: general secretion pathway protein GspB [Gammaproteobacteria bacterium]|nr:general secretion pathway protein GspB [Gammaproteobacteria bacterium]MBT7877716.1 general secretion pathway protein GspB [Gammaproteobacteria bacterium]
MSYILDALNKSEQERERKQTPGLKSLRGEPSPNRFQLRHFLYLLALLAIFNSIGVFIYFGNNSEPDSDIATQAKTPSADLLVPANAATVDTPMASSNLTAAKPAGFPAPPAAGKTVDINDLPSQVIRRLPEIQITTHIFASDSDLRMVNINGVSRKEGDLVTNSLQLVEITEEGVVMNFEGYAYAMNILEDWQNNP